jgi:hypothetical protein
MDKKTEQELLVIYDALPSLLDIATKRAESTGDSSYEIQDKLRDKFYAEGKAFKWSMPFRSLFNCFQCGYTNTQIQHMLVNPRMKDVDPALHAVDLKEEDIHGIREHGLNFSPECRRFLEHVSE